MKKGILKEVLKGVITALPFGNVINTISDNIKEDGYTAKGSINWPKMIMYIITGMIVLGRLLGVITNDDVITLIDTIHA
jgi:hypothetical protein|tara:strand:- start:118 stop:354 length:237 start_codon:yes stop_codon:yes gene_type:complete